MALFGLNKTEWILTLFLSAVWFGYAINRNLLVPIQDQLIEYYALNPLDYNLLQSLYSWPNVINCIFYGILCDKIGSNRMFFISWIIIMFGFAVMTISSIFKLYWQLCIGRIIGGIGNESVNVVLKVFLMNKFNINKHGFVFAVCGSSAALAGSVNAIWIYQMYSLTNSIQFVLSLPLIFNPILYFPLFGYILYTKNKNKTLPDDPQQDIMMSTMPLKPKQKVTKFKITKIKSFPVTFWMLNVSFCFFEMSYFSFTNIAVSFFHNMYGYSYSLSSTLVSLPLFTEFLAMPLFGYWTDKYGMKCRIIICLNIIMIIAYYSFGWFHVNMIFTIIMLLLLGIAWGMFYAVIWPSISLIIDKNESATAIGIISSSRFGVIAISYIIVGILTKSEPGSNKYKHVQYFQIILAVCSAVSAFILMKLDSKNNHKLYNSYNERMSLKHSIEIDSISTEN